MSNTEIRIQAQTADGISIGLIEPIATSATKDEIDARIDLYIDIVSRQRAKSQLIAAQFELDKAEARKEELEKQYDAALKTQTLESENRGSGRASAKTSANVDNIETNLNHVKGMIADHKKGIESLEKLVA